MLRGWKRAACRIAPATSLAALFVAIVAMAADAGYSRGVTPDLVSRYEARFGRGVSKRLTSWQEFVQRTTPASAAQGTEADAALLAAVNRFFNRVPAFTDPQHWKAEDYWATPAGTLASDGADCEDYAIAKYYTLKELGVPVARLRLVYVRAQLAGGAHMVLAYYPTPSADPLILDNLEGRIRPAKERTDLQPVYSFNDEDLMLAQANAPAIKLNPASNRMWATVMQSLQREQSN